MQYRPAEDVLQQEGLGRDLVGEQLLHQEMLFWEREGHVSARCRIGSGYGPRSRWTAYLTQFPGICIAGAGAIDMGYKKCREGKKRAYFSKKQFPYSDPRSEAPYPQDLIASEIFGRFGARAYYTREFYIAPRATRRRAIFQGLGPADLGGLRSRQTETEWIGESGRIYDIP